MLAQGDAGADGEAEGRGEIPTSNSSYHHHY